MEQALEYCFRFVSNTVRKWLEAGYQTRLGFQKMIFDGNVEFDGEKFGNPELSLVYKFNKEYDGKESNLAAPRGIEPLFPG